MGSVEEHFDPFADVPPALHAQSALLEMAELLELVRFWRERAERAEGILAERKRWKRMHIRANT